MLNFDKFFAIKINWTNWYKRLESIIKSRAPQLRVIGENGENFGVCDASEAIGKAREAGADLIEISPGAVPPVAKIMDLW